MKSVIQTNGATTVNIKTPRQVVTVDADSKPSRKMRRAMDAAQRKGTLIKHSESAADHSDR